MRISAFGEPILIPDTVRRDWNLENATGEATPGNFFPSHVGWIASILGATRLARVLAASASAGLRPTPAEIVRVPKGDRTTRPAADLAVEDQVLLSALTDLARSAIPAGYVSFTGEGDQTYSEFELFPLQQQNVQYVLEADAAGSYQNISHERLAYEIIGLTGRADVAESLARLLESWMGDTRGLPQGPTASYVLGDIYISPVSRALDRQGFRFTRYSDDFRVVAGTWAEVGRAQLALESAFYDLGLAAAPGKLRTPKLATYSAGITRANDERLQRQIFRDAFADLGDEEYAPADLELAPVTEEEVEQAEEVFNEAIQLPNVDFLSTRLIRRALPRLAAGESAAGLDRFPQLLSKYAHLTPSVATYLRALMGTDLETRAVRLVTTALNAESFKLPWQVGWMLSTLTHATRKSNAAASLSAGALESNTLPWFARGQAAIALAIHGKLPRPTEFVSVYELSARAARPDLVAAVAIGEPPWRAQFLQSVAPESPVISAVLELPVDSYRNWL